MQDERLIRLESDTRIEALQHTADDYQAFKGQVCVWRLTEEKVHVHQWAWRKKLGKALFVWDS